MKLYERITIFKITNDVDRACFFGHTTTSLAARFASLKHEAMDNTKHKVPVLDHMRKLGKEHFQAHHVTTLSGVTLDEVKACIADYVAQANQAHRAQAQEATAEHQPKQEAQKDATTEHQPQAEVQANQPARADAITEATLGHQPQQESQTEAPAEHQPQQEAQEVQPQEQQTDQDKPSPEATTEAQEQQPHTQAELDCEAQKHLRSIHDNISPISETGALASYLERYDIDQLELIRKFNFIEFPSISFAVIAT